MSHIGYGQLNLVNLLVQLVVFRLGGLLLFAKFALALFRASPLSRIFGLANGFGYFIGSPV